MTRLKSYIGLHVLIWDVPSALSTVHLANFSPPFKTQLSKHLSQEAFHDFLDRLPLLRFLMAPEVLHTRHFLLSPG